MIGRGVQLIQGIHGQIGNAGWDQMVSSMRGAIEDRSHVGILGYAIGVVVIVWVHWRVLRWVIGILETPDERNTD